MRPGCYSILIVTIHDTTIMSNQKKYCKGGGLSMGITPYLSSIIVGMILLIIVALIIYSMIQTKKNGGSSCGGSCGSCPMNGGCHKHKK